MITLEFTYKDETALFWLKISGFVAVGVIMFLIGLFALV